MRSSPVIPLRASSLPDHLNGEHFQSFLLCCVVDLGYDLVVLLGVAVYHS